MRELTQQQEDRFDGYPTDCVIGELLQAEDTIQQQAEQIEKIEKESIRRGDKLVSAASKIYDLKEENKKQAAEIADALGYAQRLFKAVAPRCEPLVNILGVLTQIDNFIAGQIAETEQNKLDMTKYLNQAIDMQAEIEELRRFEKIAMDSSTCPKCGTGIVSNCLGCKIKELKAEIERLKQYIPYMMGMRNIEGVLKICATTVDPDYGKILENIWEQIRLARNRSCEENAG